MARRAAASFGSMLVIGLALALALLFLWRVWSYTRLISSGKGVEMPQFSQSFTQAVAGGGATGIADVATADDPSLGPAEAKLTVVEFVDYECPFCNAESAVVREMAAKYKARVRFIIRDFPVQELHPQALLGALAAGCAEAQGKYWQMHDRLYAAAAGGELKADEIERAAEQSGLDMKTYKTCMEAQSPLDEIQDDANDGLAAGVRGTPTFFFNGRRVEGAVPKDAFEKLILNYVAP